MYTYLLFIVLQCLTLNLLGASGAAAAAIRAELPKRVRLFILLNPTIPLELEFDTVFITAKEEPQQLQGVVTMTFNKRGRPFEDFGVQHLQEIINEKSAIATRLDQDPELYKPWQRDRITSITYDYRSIDHFTASITSPRGSIIESRRVPLTLPNSFFAITFNAKSKSLDVFDSLTPSSSLADYPPYSKSKSQEKEKKAAEPKP